jgi:hypothetical protein
MDSLGAGDYLASLRFQNAVSALFGKGADISFNVKSGHRPFEYILVHVVLFLLFVTAAPLWSQSTP